MICLYDFENREAIFSGVHRSYKFGLFCSGGKQIQNQEADFAFYLTNISHINDKLRHFTLSSHELFLINPSTKTCPTFKNNIEAEITKKIYKKVKAWCLHETKVDFPGKPRTPFNMSNDSGLFFDKYEMVAQNALYLDSGEFQIGSTIFLPVYESKFIHQFSHRYSTFDSVSDEEIKSGNSRESSNEDLKKHSFFIKARYWLDKNNQENRFPGKWFLSYRMIVRETDERSSIAAIIPARPCSHSLSIIDNLNCINALLICGNMNSLLMVR